MAEIAANPVDLTFIPAVSRTIAWSFKVNDADTVGAHAATHKSCYQSDFIVRRGHRVFDRGFGKRGRSGRETKPICAVFASPYPHILAVDVG